MWYGSMRRQDNTRYEMYVQLYVAIKNSLSLKCITHYIA